MRKKAETPDISYRVVFTDGQEITVPFERFLPRNGGMVIAADGAIDGWDDVGDVWYPGHRLDFVEVVAPIREPVIR